MAEDNESPGLKVAVAAFITLTVILALTSYFLYARAATEEARRLLAEEQRVMSRRASSLLATQFDELRVRIGAKAEEFDAAKNEIAASFKKVDERLEKLLTTVNAAIRAAEQNGVHGPELDDARTKFQNAIAAYRREGNKNYISALDRLTDALEDLALVTAQLAQKDAGARKSVERPAGVPRTQQDQGPRTKN